MNLRQFTCYFLIMCSFGTLHAQNNEILKNSPDSSKQGFFNRFKLPVVHLKKPKLSIPYNKVKQSFVQSVGKLRGSLAQQDVYLMAGINFSKQTVSTGNFNTPFVYEVEQKNVYKAGFMGGLRLEGKFKAKHPYAVDITLNKLSTGVSYKTVLGLDPFVGEFSNFKAEDQLFNLGLAAMYKQIIPIKDTSKYKLYVVGGPSLNIRLSGQSIDNQVRDNYRKLLLGANLGLEFNNKDYYTLFFHYHRGLHSITASPIQTQFSNFNLGMMIKASDLF